MVKDLCFEIIDKCPNECKFCSSNSCYTKNTMISFDDFKRVIDYFMKQGGILELSLSGGEPFLHPDLFKMVEYSKGLGIRTVIFTSGVKKRLPINPNYTKFYKDKMEQDLKEIEEHEPWNDRLKNNVKKYYETIINPPEFSGLTKAELYELKKLKIDKIVFDYQAYEYETDSYLMGRNSHKHNCLLDSIIHTSIVGIETDIHFVPMKPNYKEIGDILEMLEIAKVNNISILNFIPQGRGLSNIKELMLSKEELNEFMEILKEKEKYFSGNIRIGIPLMNENMHMCNAGLEKLDIKYDGTVLPCPAFKELDLETMKKYGIKYYNIYTNLEEVKTPGGKRIEPLCKKVYKN